MTVSISARLTRAVVIADSHPDPDPYPEQDPEEGEWTEPQILLSLPSATCREEEEEEEEKDEKRPRR